MCRTIYSELDRNSTRIYLQSLNEEKLLDGGAQTETRDDFAQVAFFNLGEAQQICDEEIQKLGRSLLHLDRLLEFCLKLQGLRLGVLVTSENDDGPLDDVSEVD